jgi:hypothetical protein
LRHEAHSKVLWSLSRLTEPPPALAAKCPDIRTLYDYKPRTMAQSFARGEPFTLRRAVQRAAADPAVASYLRRISMPLLALNHGPSTSAEWRECIAKLQAEAEQAKRELGEARQARADTDAPTRPALPIRSPKIVDQLGRELCYQFSSTSRL